MKQILANLYSEYGRYIDSQRAIPSENDCLKPVERRLLNSVHEIAPANGKLQKSAKVVGHCIGNYHPHSDTGSYSALVGLVNKGMVIGQGNWGRSGFPEDSPPAAMRYTECKENNVVNTIISELLPYVPHKELELEKEPLYLPSPIPLGLIGEGIITGIGFNITRMPRYNYGDLLKRLYSLLINAEVKPTIVPSVKDCIVKEINQGDFEKILTTGDGEIQVTPMMKTINENTLAILGCNPLIGWTKLKNFNLKFEEENDFPYFEAIDIWNFESKTSVEININPYKKKLTKEFVEKIISLTTGKINIKVNVVDETTTTVKQVGIDHLLMQSYNKWKLANLTKFKDTLAKLRQELYDLNIIELIRAAVVNTNSSTSSIEIIADEVIKSNSNINKSEVISICNKYRIRRLIESTIDKKPVIVNIQEYQDKINTIDLEVFNIFKTKFLKM